MHKSFFMNYVRLSAMNSLTYFIGLKSKRVEIYLILKNVKLLLVLSICLLILQFMTFQGSSLLLLLKSVMDQKIMAFNP